MCFDKNAVAFSRGQTQLLHDVVDEIPDSGRGRNLRCLEGQEKDQRSEGGGVPLLLRRVFIPLPYRLGIVLCAGSGCCSAGWRSPPLGVVGVSWAPAFTKHSKTLSRKER